MGKYVLGESAARKLREMFASSNGISRRSAFSGAPLHIGEFPDPYTVRWAASADSGSGSFIIWLPSASVLIVFGQTVDLTNALSAAGDPYPSGWYLLENMPSSGGSLYLNVTPPPASSDSASLASAVFSTEASQVEGDIPILIATISKDSTTGIVTVKQNVTSALVLTRGVKVDSVSIDYQEPDSSESSSDEESTDEESTERPIEIKGWRTGLPVSETSLASDVRTRGLSYGRGSVIVREEDGSLSYKPILGLGDDEYTSDNWPSAFELKESSPGVWDLTNLYWMNGGIIRNKSGVIHVSTNATLQNTGTYYLGFRIFYNYSTGTLTDNGELAVATSFSDFQSMTAREDDIIVPLYYVRVDSVSVEGIELSVLCDLRKNPRVHVWEV